MLLTMVPFRVKTCGRTGRNEPLGVDIEQLAGVAVDGRKELPHAAETRADNPDAFAWRNEVATASRVRDGAEASGIGPALILAP